MYDFITQAKSAGFVNTAPDSDGIYRRVNLVVKYNAGLGLEMAAKGFLVFFRETLSGIIDDKGSNTLVVHLDQIEKLRGALSAVSLQSICFDDKTTIILFLLKT